MKKFYWLKLKDDFFERSEIKIIESQENGKDYILFYLKLLLKSVATQGSLRVTDRIPFDEKSLASITNTNVDVVRSAIKIFCEFGLMEVTEERTILMPEVEGMIGSETDAAERMRKMRAYSTEKCNTVTPVLQSGYNNVQKSANILEPRDTEIETETDIDIETDTDKKEILKKKSSKADLVESKFNEFWVLYPRKEGKTDALRCFKARLKEGHNPDIIITATKNYIELCKQNRTETKFIKHASTFIGSSKWFLDYLSEPQIEESIFEDTPYYSADDQIYASRHGHYPNDQEGIKKCKLCNSRKT